MWQITLKGRIDNFNRAAVNHALKPIGVAVPRNIKAGHALIGFADDKLNEAYDQALMNVSFSAARANLELKIQEVADDLLSAARARWLGRYIKTRLDSHFGADEVDGQAFKRAERELSERAWRYRLKYNMRDVGKALGDAVSFMQTALCEQNPAQAKALRHAIDACTTFDLIVMASCGVAAYGRFTPKDILCAALQKDPEAYVRGKAPMQDWVISGNWGRVVLKAGPYNDDARLDDLAKELAARLAGWDLRYYR